jgi:dolichol-phosphate mannosyltransferase
LRRSPWLVASNGSRRVGLRTFVKFVLVGATGVVVNLGSFAALLALGVNRYVASPIAIEISIVTNFLLHDAWTFRWRRRAGRARDRAVVFNVVSLASLAISYASFVVWSLVFPDLPALVHQLLAIPPATLFNFFVNSRWTFRDTGRTQS